MKTLGAIAVNKHSHQDNRGLKVLNAKLLYLRGDAESIAALGKFFVECAREMKSGRSFHRHFRDFLRDWDSSLTDVVVDCAPGIAMKNRPNEKGLAKLSNEPSIEPNGTIRMATTKHRIFTTSFASVYPHYVAKAERKGRKKSEVDAIICWLTGYSQRKLESQLKKEKDFESFFKEAPKLNPSRTLIKGVVCGVRVEEVEDPTMREIRYLDKLIDELAKGKAMDKILRTETTKG